MKLFSGSVILIAALVACCFLQIVQGAQMPHIRRSLDTTAHGTTSVTQLARRWWFGFSGSLGRVQGHPGEMVVVTSDGMIHRHPAGTAETQRWLNYLQRKGVKYVVVDEGGKTN
ncbi:hypothetical protein PSEUBRA_003910 [Kalmanozyma brasiliensis GHG001]|uniref:uncharacterized protein n=1 Tax=Kalmanozyma brasiliensis (strain GHG001) TaxID=1365824 RepID=UPI002867E3F3|nr:uncharacterized protein PSEUBRA_003910 [Kalmanozyma brasiliensis GHG001]KAF6767314.1 hypothetical protein PSEUBRA_003910 [Kalmanozyma brasiliensis GHG001]